MKITDRTPMEEPEHIDEQVKVEMFMKILKGEMMKEKAELIALPDSAKKRAALMKLRLKWKKVEQLYEKQMEEMKEMSFEF